MRLALVSILLLILGACGGDGNGPIVPPTPAVLQSVSGGGQSGAAGTQLSSPLVVKVVDASGNPVAGVAVNWNISSGGGSLTVLNAVTDAQGLSQARLTLGPTAGENRATATVSGLTAVTFTATGNAGPIARVIAEPDSAVLRALGDTVRFRARATDQFGNTVANATFNWTSLDPGIATVDATGLATAVAGGTARIVASASGPADTARAVVRQQIATIAITPANPSVRVTETLQLTASATDANGGAISGVTFTWASAATSIASVDANGRVLGIAEGTATITATASGIIGSVTVTVLPAPAGAPQITTVTPDPLVPAGMATVTGVNFAGTPAENTVTVGGVAVTVNAASSTELTITLPARGAFTCEPTRSVNVAVTVGGVTAIRSHPLAVAVQHALAVGAAAIVSAADTRCNELSVTGGRYFATIYNTTSSAAAISAFEVRGAAAGSAAGLGAPVLAARTQETLRAPRVIDAERLRAAAAHWNLLEQGQRLAETLRATGALSQLHAAPATTPAPPPNEGDTLSLRVHNGMGSLCGSFTDIRARVVYVGSTGVVAEDIAAPLAGTMNADFRAVGMEFDTLMVAILRANFGDPLKVDGQLDNNQRLVMVFTPVVNNMSGVLGFVSPGDFFSRSQCASSNFGEYFYARVPTSASTGFNSGERGDWMRRIRGTIIHEVKHITSLAEHASRNAGLEDLWLEEATAMVSEELWARVIFGYGQNGNVTYQQSLHCEFRPTFAECAGKPLVMGEHFGFLYEYYSAVETRTPLGQANSSDFQFYGSGWLFTRWSVDQYAMSEPAFLSALTQEPVLKGVANLAARSGKSYEELLSDWVLANAADDFSTTFVPARVQHRHPSWHTRDVFAGLNTDFPSVFTRRFPLNTRAVGFGAFSVPVNELRGGSASFLELSGAQTANQLIELRSTAGGDPPPNLRIAFIRVE